MTTDKLLEDWLRLKIAEVRVDIDSIRARDDEHRAGDMQYTHGLLAALEQVQRLIT